MSVQILYVVGAPPNFMEAATVVCALTEQENGQQVLVPTDGSVPDVLTSINK